MYNGKNETFPYNLQFKEKSDEKIKSLETEKEQLSLTLTSTKTLLEEKVGVKYFM